MPTKYFVKGDPRINRKGGPPGGYPGGGRPSELHRAECRRLVEQLKLRNWVGAVASGKPEDTTVTLRGKVIKIPANINSRLKAVQFLTEHGYGAPPKEISIAGISSKTISKFENSLVNLLQKYVPAEKRSTELVKQVMACAAILLEGEEDAEEE